jgi:type I restriction enzyme S subunit
MKWPVKQLGDICEIVGGATPNTTVKEYWGDDYFWATPKDLSDLNVSEIKTTSRKISSLGLKSCAATLLPINSVLFSSRAPIGLVAINAVPIATNQGFKNLVPNKNLLDTKYLYHWLTCNRKKIDAMGVGATFKEVSKAIVSKIEIPLPPLAEQQRIAAVLDTADHILRLREATIAKLDQLASTTFDEMYEALDAVSTKSLGEILVLQRGASPRPIADWMTENEDGVNWIKIADATASDKYIFKCKERIKKEAVAMTRYVKSGDFLLSNSMSFGRPYILKTDGCIHDGWMLIRDTKNVFEQDFLYAVLSCKTVKEQFKKLATGAVVKNLNIDAVSKVKVKIPEKKIQKIFSEKMHELEANKANHLKQLTIIKTLLSSIQNQSFAMN